MSQVKDRDAMIAGMRPELVAGRFHFCSLSDPDQIGTALPDALGFFREAEGLSLILPEASARALGQSLDMPLRQISLQVMSSLAGVGLTAAVAGLLAEHGIACNMVAAFHHDHAFVPATDAERAVGLLRDLADRTAALRQT